jgi:hypothetical protein
MRTAGFKSVGAATMGARAREVPQDLHIADGLPFSWVQFGQSFAMGYFRSDAVKVQRSKKHFPEEKRSHASLYGAFI